MKVWKTLLLKAFMFLLIFVVLFFSIQNVFAYNEAAYEALGDRFDAYKEEIKTNDIDVLFFGTSSLRYGISPMVMWKEQGITSMNFGISWANVFYEYFLIEYALQFDTPKLIVLDFSDMTETRKANGSTNWQRTYFKTWETLRDSDLAAQFLKEIEETDQDQDRLFYLFPLLRNHSLWTSISKDNFVEKESAYKEYDRNVYPKQKVTPIIINEKSDDTPQFEVSEFSRGYYERIIDLCNEKGIPVAAVSFPEIDMLNMEGHYQAVQAFCDEMNIPFYCYSSLEAMEEIGMDAETDFINTTHVNITGGAKISQDLARRFSTDFGLVNHKTDKDYSFWDSNWKEYFEAHKEYLQNAGY